MLAHHEAMLVVQAVAPIGLTGWAAAIGARWFSLSRRAAAISTPARRDNSTDHPTSSQGSP